MQLRCEDFFKIISTAQHHLHPNSRILPDGQILIFKRMARQNPPVLQPLEMVCSRSQHPLSSVSGRRRYNTLDFATAKSCANRALSPLLEVPKQRNLQSLYNPSPFTHLWAQTEKRFCEHRSINAKIPESSSCKKMNSLRFSITAFKHRKIYTKRYLCSKLFSESPCTLYIAMLIFLCKEEESSSPASGKRQVANSRQGECL